MYTYNFGYSMAMVEEERGKWPICYAGDNAVLHCLLETHIERIQEHKYLS